MDFESLIDELENLLQRAVHVPGGKALKIGRAHV